MALVDISHDLIDAARRGEREPIEELVQIITPDLYRILFSVLRDHDDTDEVVQETLVRVFRYIGSLKDTKRFPAWVMRIGMNQVQTYRAKRGRTRMIELENPSEISNSAVVLAGMAPTDPRDAVMNQETRTEIMEAMETLPKRQRMATVLFEVEGLSIKEIAKALECSEGAVKFNIHEGRKKLKLKLLHLVEGRRWGRKKAEEVRKANFESRYGSRSSTGKSATGSQSEKISSGE